jgi:hypothetical protein
MGQLGLDAKIIPVIFFWILNKSPKIFQAKDGSKRYPSPRDEEEREQETKKS